MNRLDFDDELYSDQGTGRERAARWATRMLASADVVILDTETTGLDSAAEVIQIGMIAEREVLDWRPLRSPLRWYGGKGSMAQHIVDLLPPHTHFVEVFAGGASVLFRKPPSALETINDSFSALVTFYRVLRNPDLFDLFARACNLTPHSREEWARCDALWRVATDPVELAWSFFIACRQSFSGDMTSRGWSYSVARAGSSSTAKYLSAVDGLPAVHARLRYVQVECADWSQMLTRYNGPEVLLYCDPPYVLDTRVGGKRYDHEMTRDDHRTLSGRLLETRSMVVLSGYRDAEIHGPLEDAGWERLDMNVSCGSANRSRVSAMGRTESIWRNPAAVAACGKRGLFAEVVG